MIVNLPKIDNIQVVAMSMTGNRIEVYKYTDKFTGEEVKAYLPVLEPFGRAFPMLEYETQNRFPSIAKEAAHHLKECIELAFFKQVVFASENSDDISKLTLGILGGPEMIFAASRYVSEEPADFARLRIPAVAWGYDGKHLDEKGHIYVRLATFYNITGKIANLE
jgi:hypothetical protein